MLPYAFGVASAFAVLIILLELLRRQKLRERHAVWWILGSLIALVFALFPGLLSWASGVAGVKVPINLLFFLGLIVLFLVCVQQSIELNKLDSRSRKLAEELVLLQDRIRRLEKKPTQTKDPGSNKPKD